MTTYLYRRGNGNDGNFPRYIVELSNADCPYAFLSAAVANDYIAGKRVRRHIVRNIVVDGEPEFGLNAVVYEGPEGETDFGAAWLTAALEPLTEADRDFYTDRATSLYTPRQVLDRAAWRQYTSLRKNITPN